MCKVYSRFFGVVVAVAVFVGGVVENRAMANTVEGFDFRLVSAAGGNANFRFGGFAAMRFGWLPESSLSLEVNTFLPYGEGANILIDVYRNEVVRVHLLDPGVFFSFFPETRIVGRKFERKFDLTVGGGMEVRLCDRLSLSADLRWFIPDPWDVSHRYGFFSFSMYRNAVLSGGTLLVGFSYSLGTLGEE